MSTAVPVVLLALWIGSGCARTLGPAASGEPPPEAERAVASAAPGIPAPLEVSAAGLYEGCRERVEGPSTLGECATDADCGSTGCSQEVCVATSVGPVTTTCEILPCFQVLESCHCNEGLCSWTLSDAVPRGRRLPGFESPTGASGVPAAPGPVPR